MIPTPKRPLFTLVGCANVWLVSDAGSQDRADCIPRSCRPAREMVARLKHLLDRLANDSNLLANDPHTQTTSIHTSLHLGH